MSLQFDDNLDISIFNFFQTKLYQDGWLVSGTNYAGSLIDSYPDDDMIKQIITVSEARELTPDQLRDKYVLPVIGVDISTDSDAGLELGSTSRLVRVTVAMAIFAETKRQRNTLGGFIKGYLRENIPIYNYNDWTSPVLYNYAVINRVVSNNIIVVGSPNKALRHAKEIQFTFRIISP